MGAWNGVNCMRHPSMPGNSAFCALSQVGCLNKTQPSAFHGPNTPEKTTVQTRLNNKKPPVEHLCWINAVFRAGSRSVSSAKNNPILRPMDGNSHRRPEADRYQHHHARNPLHDYWIHLRCHRRRPAHDHRVRLSQRHVRRLDHHRP